MTSYVYHRLGYIIVKLTSMQGSFIKFVSRLIWQAGHQFIEQYAGKAQLTSATIREVHGGPTLRLDYEYHRGMNMLEDSGFLYLVTKYHPIFLDPKDVCASYQSSLY